MSWNRFRGVPRLVLTAILLLFMAAALAFALIALTPKAHAGCTCECVDGRVQPICDSALGLKPLCPPRLCPIDHPTLQPLARPTLPPLGTSQCRQARTCDSYGNCRWTTVCS